MVSCNKTKSFRRMSDVLAVESIGKGETWVFINEQNINEVTLAKQLLKSEEISNKLQVFLVNNDNQLSNNKEEFYYFDQDGNYINKISVDLTPVFVKQDGDKLTKQHIKLSSDESGSFISQIVANYIQ